MIATPKAAAPVVSSPPQIRRFFLAVVVLTLGFSGLLWQLFWFAIADDLFSYIPLIPAVSLYLAWIQKEQLPRRSPAVLAAGLFAAAGLTAIAACVLFSRAADFGASAAFLAVGTLGWILMVTAAGCWFLGGAAMRRLAFPFFLLLFMLPLPPVVRGTIESALQQGSAVVADWFFTLSGTPFFRSGTLFRLPDITLELAPECSGIHSTWILFITSLVASHLVLRRPWRRAILYLAVIPLALLRNGFRVFVIGQLCIHIGPQMIDSPIHRHGGPLFFALSLVPFFLLLYFLRKRELTETPGPLSKSEPI
jgi:exosortase C (VPDSG-CTERM-specific)